MENLMFCYQCQETAGCTGCTKFGVCGKSPDLARMQDLLIYVTKGLSEITTKLREENKTIPFEINNYVTLNLFTTITNANFDNDVFYTRVLETLKIKDELLSKLTNKKELSDAAIWNGKTKEELDKKSYTVGILTTENEDVRSLRELITYGLKGMSAYLKHANELGYDSEEVNIFLQKALAATLNDSLSLEELISLTLETGKFGVDGMALLEKVMEILK